MSPSAPVVIDRIAPGPLSLLWWLMLNRLKASISRPIGLAASNPRRAWWSSAAALGSQCSWLSPHRRTQAPRSIISVTLLFLLATRIYSSSQILCSASVPWTPPRRTRMGLKSSGRPNSSLCLIQSSCFHRSIWISASSCFAICSPSGETFSPRRPTAIRPLITNRPFACRCSE